jgi:hypothetical protein
MRRFRICRCCQLIRGPPERPALAVEIPADVNTGCSFAKACCLASPESNGLARFASAAGAGDASQRPARSDPIVRDYLRVFFVGRQSRNARRRPGHRRVPISAPRAARAPSTLGPPRRGPISPRAGPECQKSPAGDFPCPLRAGLRHLGQGRAESPSALSVPVASATACGPIAKRVSPRRFSAFRIKVLPRAISLIFA